MSYLELFIHDKIPNTYPVYDEYDACLTIDASGAVRSPFPARATPIVLSASDWGTTRVHDYNPGGTEVMPRTAVPEMLPITTDEEAESFAKKLFEAAAKDPAPKTLHHDVGAERKVLDGVAYSVGQVSCLGVFADARPHGGGCGFLINTHAVKLLG